MNISLNNPVINLATNTALVGLAAYATRSYLVINPAHAALFALGTFVSSMLGKQLIKDTGQNEWEFSGRAIRFIAINVLPVSTAIFFKVFPPIQAFAAVGLITCATSACTTFSATSVWSLKI